MPLFSVIVPVYNMERYLVRCVVSILNQSFDDFELILVDDGSRDGSSILCDAIAEVDDRVRVIHKSNGGLVSARNVGIKEAFGDYIIWVDADDWIELDMLKVIHEDAVVPYRPDAVIYGAQHVFEDGSRNVLPCHAPQGFYNRDRMESFILPNMIYYSEQPFCKGLFNPMACNKMYKTSILRECYCRDESIRMGEDAAFVFEALYRSNSLVMLDNVFYNYYKGNESSITSMYDPGRFANNRRLNDYISSRIGGEEPWLDDQLNALKTYLLFMGVFHESRFGPGFKQSCFNLRESIDKTNALGDISSRGLPLSARLFLTLLKTKMFPVVLLATRALDMRRG